MPNDFSSFSQKSFLSGCSFMKASDIGVIRPVTFFMQQTNLRKSKNIAGDKIQLKIM
jgi:hypothetical protein